jgi:hypothetical protein
MNRKAMILREFELFGRNSKMFPEKKLLKKHRFTSLKHHFISVKHRRVEYGLFIKLSLLKVRFGIEMHEVHTAV